MRKNKHSILPDVKTIAAIVIGFLIVGLLAFSVKHYYDRTGETGEMEFFCVEEQCFVTIHVHADVEFDLCGQDFSLSKEEGALEEVHTHKESNTLHWHAPLPADENGSIVDYTNMSLGNTFKSLEYNLNSTCFETWCNGTQCNGEPGELLIYINDVESAEREKYIWKDGDSILIKFK